MTYSCDIGKSARLGTICLTTQRSSSGFISFNFFVLFNWLQIFENRHLHIPMFSSTGWSIGSFAVQMISSIQHWNHICWVSIPVHSFCHTARVSNPYTKIENPRVWISIISIFVLSYHQAYPTQQCHNIFLTLALLLCFVFASDISPCSGLSLL